MGEYRAMNRSVSRLRSSRASRETSARDAGFTLPELLVTLSVTSILLVAISAALIGMLNLSTQATDRLTESRDISFIQTRVPVDLGSALASSNEVGPADIRSDLRDQLDLIGIPAPSLDILDTLPGTNVLTVVRPDTVGISMVISYRYEQDGTEWVINRYQFQNSGLASQTLSVNNVAQAVAPPPPGSSWQAGDPVDFAVEVSPKGNASRLAGQDVTVTFASGRTFSTGGGGLSSQNALPPADFPDLGDPLSPPSRCGKRIAIVLDTSGSIPEGFGGASLEQAAVGFIDGFLGTPTTISLNGFDRTGYGMSIDLANPATIEQRAPFYSVLNDSAQVEGMRDRVEALDDIDGQWANGQATVVPNNPLNLRDPDGNGVFWGQAGDGTNWEGGLLTVFRDPNGVIYASEQPDLVVFVTDGQPNFRRNGANQVEFSSDADAAEAARRVSDDLRGFFGTRIVGVMVGDKRTNTTFVRYLQDLLGSRQEQWNGVVGVGSNAADAGLFLGNFDQLGNILRSIVIGQCGGTVTLQKRIDTGITLSTPRSGTWSYTSNDDGTTSTRTLDRSITSSVTFDYSFADGVGSKSVRVTEQPVDGFVWDRAECSVNGSPVFTTPLADGTPGLNVDVPADGAVSCLMISRPV